jgi:hypothetical protein
MERQQAAAPTGILPAVVVLRAVAPAPGQDAGLHPRREAPLLQAVPDAMLDGPGPEDRAFGDLPVRALRGDERGHLALTPGSFLHARWSKPTDPVRRLIRWDQRAFLSS